MNFFSRWIDGHKRFLLSSEEILDLEQWLQMEQQNRGDHYDHIKLFASSRSENKQKVIVQGNELDDDQSSEKNRQKYILGWKLSKEEGQDESSTGVSDIPFNQRNVLVDPLDNSIIAQKTVPSDSWCFSMSDYFSSIPLSQKHSAGLRSVGSLNWVIYTEILLSSSMRESRITTSDQAAIPLYVLAIRNALFARVS